MPRAPTNFKSAIAGASSADNGLQRGNLTHQQRLAIVRKKDEEPRWTQEDLARWAKKQFGLQRQPTQSTISNILRARERLETMTTSLDAKSVRPVKHPELDAALLLWLRDQQNHPHRQRIQHQHLQNQQNQDDQQQQHRLVVIHGDAVRDQARHLAQIFQYMDEMTYSNGWMRSFLARHGVEFRRNQVDSRETVSLNSIQALMTAYPKRDVFTFVTTNLWYRLEPKKELLAARSASHEPSLVVGLCANMDGSEKWSPLFVARTREPPSFQQQSAFQWHFLEYYWNGRAQMTSTIFEAWVKRLNQRMAQSHRRVLLVVDNAPSYLNVTLSHVRVVVHSGYEKDQDDDNDNHPNAHASVLQSSLAPLSRDIVSTFKAFYHKRHLACAVDRAEAGETNRYAVSQLKAMRWVEQAWDEVPAELLVDAWSRVGLATPPAAQPDSQSMSEVVATKKTAIHKQITDLLEQLDVPGRIKSQDVVTPRGEDDAPHYLYDDATIVALVVGALHDNDTTHGDDDVVSDITDSAETLSRADPLGATSHLHRSLLIKLEQLRGVIQSIDEDSPPNEELVSVLAFLRRRQATLRAELQRLAREADRQASSSAVPNNTHVALKPPPNVPATDPRGVLEEAVIL